MAETITRSAQADGSRGIASDLSYGQLHFDQIYSNRAKVSRCKTVLQRSWVGLWALQACKCPMAMCSIPISRDICDMTLFREIRQRIFGTISTYKDPNFRIQILPEQYMYIFLNRGRAQDCMHAYASLIETTCTACKHLELEAKLCLNARSSSVVRRSTFDIML